MTAKVHCIGSLFHSLIRGSHPLQVGGKFSATVIPQMNDFGRISQCGAISEYNVQKPLLGIAVMLNLCLIVPFSLLVESNLLTVVTKQLKIQGFMAGHYASQWPAAFKEMAAWIAEVWMVK